jgi:hypothetical protein
VRLVVVARPDARRAAAARGANACGAGRAQESGTATASGIGPSDGAGPPRASDNRTPLRRVSDVLAAKFTMVVDAARDVPPFLYAALVLAIALLALAVFPRHALPGLRAQALLAYNRKVIALAGTVAFATVVAGAYFVVW